MVRAFHTFKLTLLLLVLSFTGGCTNMAMNSVMTSWENQPVSEVIAAWGKPSEELKVAGKHLFIWNTSDEMSSQPYKKGLASLRDTRYCMRMFDVDRAGKVTYGTWEGDNCPGFFSGWGK